MDEDKEYENDEFENEDEDFEDDEDDEENEDSDPELAFWEREANNTIRSILESAEFDLASGEVTLLSEDWGIKGEEGTRSFSDFGKLRQALVEIGDGRMTDNVPFEGGEPVFSTDSDDLVDAALQEFGIPQFFVSLQPPPDSDLLISLPDLADVSELEAVQVDIADINAALIQYFAKHPEAMYTSIRGNSRK